MPEKDNKAETIIKVVGKSAAPYVIGLAPYVIGLGVLAAGAYYLSKKDEEISDFFGGIGAGAGGLFSGAAEGAGALLGDAAKAITEPITVAVTFEPSETKAPSTVKAIESRKAPGQEWSLKPETVKALEEYVSTPGGVVEEQLQKYFPPKVPTGELSEYTPEEQKRTVFEDKQYKGPSLLGWFTRPAGAITRTGPGRPAQTGVYVPGVGIAPTVTLGKEGWSKTKATRSRKAGTSGLYTPTITPAPIKPKYTPEEKLNRFKSDIAAGRNPITGESLKKKKKEKEKERKTGGDIHGRSPAWRR